MVRTHERICMGLLVDELGEIPEVPQEDVQPIGNVASGPGVLTLGVVSNLRPADDRYGMLSVLDAERLCQRLGCRCNDEMPRVESLVVLD